LAEDVADLVTAREMLRESFLAASETTEIDDPFETRDGRRLREIPRRIDITLAKGALSGRHRVDEIIRGATAFERGAERRGVEHVSLDDLDAIGPVASPEPVGIARETPDAIALDEELRNEPATDVAGRARDQERKVGIQRVSFRTGRGPGRLAKAKRSERP
jgi:hypothetical protein